MQKNHLLRYFKIAIILLICSPTAYPQDATGTIIGIVTDSVGAVIPNARLVFQPQTGGRPVTGSSNENGEFQVARVLPGTYKIEYKLSSLAYRNDKVIVRPNESTKLEIKVSYEANCPAGPDGQALQLSDSDRTEIISSILEDALGKNFISDGHGLLKKQKDPIILLLETIKTEWVKKPVGINLQLMTQTEVDKKANDSGDFLYLSFSNWHVGANCVVVTLNNSWAVASDSPWVYLSGGGSTFIYKKDSARKWVGEYIGGWIS